MNSRSSNLILSLGQNVLATIKDNLKYLNQPSSRIKILKRDEIWWVWGLGLVQQMTDRASDKNRAFLKKQVISTTYRMFREKWCNNNSQHCDSSTKRVAVSWTGLQATCASNMSSALTTRFDCFPPTKAWLSWLTPNNTKPWEWTSIFHQKKSHRADRWMVGLSKGHEVTPTATSPTCLQASCC